MRIHLHFCLLLIGRFTMTVRAMQGGALKPLVAGVMACLAMSSVQAFNDDLGPLAPLDSRFEVGAGFPKPTFWTP